MLNSRELFFLAWEINSLAKTPVDTAVSLEQSSYSSIEVNNKLTSSNVGTFLSKLIRNSTILAGFMTLELSGNSSPTILVFVCLFLFVVF